MSKIKILVGIALGLGMSVNLLPAQATVTTHPPKITTTDIARVGHHRHHDQGEHRGWYKKQRHHYQGGGRNGYRYNDTPQTQPLPGFFRPAERQAPIGRNCTATRAGMICR
jgi:hypothetical protein